MPKLLMLMGLPGSGKSTIAIDLLRDPSWVRVNKDDIRTLLSVTGWRWSPENEKDVVAERDRRIDQALSNGYHVVSDDTNFGRKHKVRLEQLARQHRADFEIQRIDVPLEVCKERNRLRAGAARVPDGSIDKMYWDFIARDPSHWPLSAQKDTIMVETYTPRPGTERAIICDLDGTLSLFKEKGHRGPYDASKCNEDDLNPVVAEILTTYADQGYRIVLCSGREMKYRQPTIDFLNTHVMPCDNLLMRATGDTRKDSIVKYELFNTHIRDHYDVRFVLDDRDQVVKMWRSLGLTVLQVADGDF